MHPGEGLAQSRLTDDGDAGTGWHLDVDVVEDLDVP